MEKIMTGAMLNAQMVKLNIKPSVLRREELMLIIIIIRLSFKVMLKVTLVGLKIFFILNQKNFYF